MKQTLHETQQPKAELRESRNTRGRYYDDDMSRFAITIGKTQAEVFQFWRDLTNLPKFMKDLKSVEILSEKRSKWKVEVASGLSVEWTAEITKERPNEMIAWKSIDGSEVDTWGSVWFWPAPEGRGTVVSLSLDYKIPGGKLAELAAKLLKEDPETLIQTNLHRLKALLETGEIPTTEGQPSGREEVSEGSTTH